jgi:hypothetical protein
MSARYLEISSIYRNRTQYPNASDFEVIIGSTNESNYENLYLPSYPEYYLYVGRQQVSGETLILDDPINPQVTANILKLYTKYAGYFLYLQKFPFVYPNNGQYGRTITSFVDTESRAYTVSPFNPADVLAGDNVQFNDPSPDLYPSTGNLVYFNLQGLDMLFRFPITKGSSYIGKFLMDEDAPPGVIDARVITEYNVNLGYITVESPFTYVPAPSATAGLYNQVRRMMTIRSQLPIVRGEQLITVNAKRNEVTLDAYASTQTNIYVNNYLYIQPSLDDNGLSDTDQPNALFNKMTFDQYLFKIIAYDGPSRTALLDKSISFGIGDGLLPLISPDRPYNILGGPQNFYSPLQYSGSIVSSSEPKCYAVGLTCLVLPNVELQSGSKIAFYPYVYVELRGIGSSKVVGTDIIYSNNPNADKAIFIVPIVDIADPEESPFIKLDAVGITQTIKFRPNDSFPFRVYLPDGKPFKPVQDDYPPPLLPNANLQIEAVFSFEPV